MKKEILSDISKVSSETKGFDLAMSEDLDKIAGHLTTVLSDDDLDEMVEKTSSIEKEAKLINEGDTVIAVDAFAPLFKGRSYLVVDASIPGFIAVKELDSNGGCDVGIFAVNRFSIDWHNR